MLLTLDLTLELGAVGLAAAGGWLLYQLLYVAVPPNQALVLFGRRARPTSGPRDPRSRDVVARAPRVLIGGGTVLAPWNKAFTYLSLGPIDVEATVRAVHSVEGGAAAGWEVALAVQAKIPAEPEALRAAAENLFGMSREELVGFVRRAVEASVPLVLARLGTAEAEPDWDRLGSEIQATVAPELIPSGLIVRSVSVRELHRIAPGANPGARAEVRSRPPALPGAGYRAAAEVNARLNRIERGLSVMGTQVDRMIRERPNRGDATTGPFDPELGLGPAAAAEPSYDSMEDGAPPPARTPPAGARRLDGGEPPGPSDEESPR